MINLDIIKTFEGGLSTDLTNDVEKKNTFIKGINGRLYSKNGVISFAGGQGTKLVYQNNEVVKYLGYYSFKDEIIVFAKCCKGEDYEGEQEICETELNANAFTISTGEEFADIAGMVGDAFSENSTEIENCYIVGVPPVDATDFDLNFNCSLVNGIEIDFSLYYGTDLSNPNLLPCSINENIVPENNVDYLDCIISLKPKGDVLVGTLLWKGMQNWNINAKITTEGVDENEFYKRVYYTDAINYRRVVNIKDRRLPFRSGEEFNQILNNILLQPEIKSIQDGGQLSAMKVLYVYRVISENGQLSEFSTTSKFAKILIESDPITYRGGDSAEGTNKYVTIACNIINAEPSSEIEAVALEYEAYGFPTSIRSLGRKPAASIVEFNHYGNEPEFADDVTYNDIINFTNTWKYCNDFTSKKNKLIAGGLRSNPVPTEINNLDYLFLLHGWDENGDSHDCLINPEPWTYRFIDPSNEDDLIYIKQKVFRTLSSFGPTTLKFKNRATGDFLEISFPSLGLENYTNINSLVIAWLLNEQTTNIDFLTYFPNLEVSDYAGQLLLKPINDLVITDFSDYIFESSNSQFIENFDNDIVFLPVTVDTNNLVHGGQSLGFNQGTGVRVTYREFKEPLLNQATAVYDGNDPVLDFIKPSGEKYLMKGEIYRIAFQAYDNDSTRYFALPMGDLMIPNINDLKLEIDNNGNAVITSQRYVNQSVQNGILYGHGIKMHFEVRLSCELQKLIPMYKILMVERNEDNRTILCQGIGMPMQRTLTTYDSHPMPTEVEDKWNLLYFGGPCYEEVGLNLYDTQGENYESTAQGRANRVMTHRGLMSFDSPDIFYNKISSQFVKNSRVSVLAKLNTDHTPDTIMNHGGFMGYDEEYPKFSRKILEDQLEGDLNLDNLPRWVGTDGSNNNETTRESYWINISVYSNYSNYIAEHIISKTETLNRGELITGSAFNLVSDVSNNTYGLPNPCWYYGSQQRDFELVSDHGSFDIFKSATNSPGYPTVIIKTADDLFTPAFVGPNYLTVKPEIRQTGNDNDSFGDTRKQIYDTIPLINLYRNNRESVFGGRSQEAYSRNTYIPLSRTIPTLQTSNGTQFFDAGGDTYMTLNIRTKNDAGETELTKNNYYNGGRQSSDYGKLNDIWKRNAAWAYAVVIESQVEPKDTYQYEFYRVGSSHNFEIFRPEIINGCYFNEDILKSYIPKPYKFKDDPNQNNVIAVSDVKLAGEAYDAWTIFKPNNFYAELEKNKGSVTNLIKQEEEVYAIQEQQTSHIYIGTERMINDSEGNTISLKQGSGTVIDGHKIISPYGTSVRRAVTEVPEFGFVFFDERAIEFVKIKDPLLFKNTSHLKFLELFKNNPVIDSESYYDFENKESNILLITKNGDTYCLSYNEALKCFNDEFEYNNCLYIMFDKKVYAPIIKYNLPEPCPIKSEDLHQLNRGPILNFFNEQKKLTLRYVLSNTLNKVFQLKTLESVSNLNYPFLSIFVKSNLGYDRTILGKHHWYKIREGMHSVPMINDTNDPEGISDVRGGWMEIEIIAESIDESEVQITSVKNNIRISHQ